MPNHSVREKKKSSKAMWPVMGLVLGLALAAIAYVAAPLALNWAVGAFAGFTGTELPPEQMRIFFAFLIFVVLSGIAALIVAIALPKKKVDNMAKEANLRKERERKQKEDAMRRKRKRALEHETRRIKAEQNQDNFRL